MGVYDKYVAMAYSIYDDALCLLDRGDIYDASEKAWCAIESAREALLVSIGVPEDKARNVEFGVTFFVKILRKLGRRDLVEKYYNFDYCLHIKGFYEIQIPLDILKEKIYEAKEWISQVIDLIDNIKNIDFSEAIRLMDESLKIKRKILQMNKEYYLILQNIDTAISKAQRA
ncbi:MAG: PaREP1 family protein [Candidatus Njordarchaeota archaeon]